MFEPPQWPLLTGSAGRNLPAPCHYPGILTPLAQALRFKGKETPVLGRFFSKNTLATEPFYRDILPFIFPPLRGHNFLLHG
jgi:hypothetical protein